MPLQRSPIYFVLFFLCFITPVISQNIDSLNAILNQHPHDTVRLSVLVKLSEVCEEDDILKYAVPAAELSNKLLATVAPENKILKNSLLTFKANALNNQGYFYKVTSGKKLAFEKFKQASDIFLAINDKMGYASTLNNLSTIAWDEGNLSLALEYLLKALKIYEQMQDKKHIAQTYNVMGSVYQLQHDFKSAIKYFQLALDLVLTDHIDDALIPTIYSNLGVVYAQHKQPEKAIEYYSKAIALMEKMNLKRQLLLSVNNLATVYLELHQTTNAFECLTKGRKMITAKTDRAGVCYFYNTLATYYNVVDNADSVIYYANKALNMTNEMSYASGVLHSAQELSRAYLKKKDYARALQNAELYYKIRDSIGNSESKLSVLRMQLTYDYNKKTTTDSIKAVEVTKINNEEIKRKENQRYFLFGCIFLTLVFGVLMINRNRIAQKQKNIIGDQKKLIEQQKNLVEIKQNEILDSIKYARRIQQSLMPSLNYIKKQLNKK